MPHNLFLHSEIIQSREWNLKDENVIEQQLKYEFKDPDGHGLSAEGFRFEPMPVFQTISK